MAVRRLADEQPDDFAFTPQNLSWAKGKIKDYPEGRQASAVIPLLWRAQEQHQGWLPEPAIRLVADMLEMPYIRVLEIATFYTMFQLKPVGSVAHIGVCGTTPCMLRGSDDLIAVCKERIAPRPFELSADGRFSWEEVECAGACVNAPMVQIGPDTYEDLTADSFRALLDALEAGERPEPGPQSDRRASEPITGATTLQDIDRTQRPQAAPAEPEPTPDADVDPASPAAADQNVAHPDPRDRTTVEATRATDRPVRDPSPVADQPKTNGRSASAPDAPAKQKGVDDPGQTPDKGPVSAAGRAGEARSASPTAQEKAEAEAVEEDAKKSPEEARAQANRAAPAAEYADQPPVREPTSGKTPDEGGAAADEAPPPPDTVAAERADQAGRRPRALPEKDRDRADNLQMISGIGPVIEKTLHDLGIYRFEQIAAWTSENKEWVNAYLAFKGRIDREKWVEQATALVSSSGSGKG